MGRVVIPRVLAPAATTLAAGLLIGYSLGTRSGGGETQEIPNDLLAWEDAVGVALELDGQQRDDLRNLLYVYHGERQRLLHRYLADAGDDWTAMDQRYEGLLHTRIFTPAQQARAAALAIPFPVVAAASPR